MGNRGFSQDMTAVLMQDYNGFMEGSEVDMMKNYHSNETSVDKQHKTIE